MGDEEKCVANLATAQTGIANRVAPPAEFCCAAGRVSVRNLDIKALPAAMYFDPRFRKIKTLDLSSNALNTIPDVPHALCTHPAY